MFVIHCDNIPVVKYLLAYFENSLNLRSRTMKIILFTLFVFAFSTAAFSGLLQRPKTDFDGDGKADISVFRRSDQTWYIQKSSGGYRYVRFGNDLDRPVPGDYDGDGIADIAVHRELLPIHGTWWVINSGNQSISFTAWGEMATWYFDLSAPADYDGDGKTDLAYYRVGDVVGDPGTYCILQSSTNTGIFIDWGLGDRDRPVPADYDGDGKADIAIYRNGQWWIRQSSNVSVRVEQFGIASDKVVPGDFDGDGKADIAVWRPSDGVWYWRSSLNGGVNYVQ